MNTIFDIFYSFEFLSIFNFSFIFFTLIYFNKYFNTNYYTAKNCFAIILVITTDILIFSQFFAPVNYTIFNFMYNIGFFEFFSIFFLVFLFFSFTFLASAEKSSFNNYEFILIIFLTFTSGILFIASSDFILFFLCLELFSILSFTLIMKRRMAINAEASFKYLIFASLATIILLFAFFIIFFSSGITNIYLLNLTKIFYNYSINFLFIIIVLSFMIKYGIFPFHSWVPDVYQASANTLFSFFTTFTKLFIIIPFIKILSNITIEDFNIFFLIFITFFGIVTSTVLGFQQLTFRRLFAYSSISNAGLIFLLFVNLTKNSFSIIINFTLVYVFIVITILLTFVIFRRYTSLSEIIYIPEFQNSPEKSLFISSFFSLNIFFLSGMPPFGLFFPKVWIFRDFFFYHSHLFFITLVVFFFTLLNIFYYCRIIQYVMSFSSFEKPSVESPYITSFNTFVWFFVLLLTFITIFIPFYFNKNYFFLANILI